jgi:hypothetical protein
MLYAALVTLLMCLFAERLRPGWRLPHVPGWRLRVLTVNGVQLPVGSVAGLTWERWFSAASVLQTWDDRCGFDRRVNRGSWTCWFAAMFTKTDGR